MNFRGLGFYDSPKYIYMEMIKRNMDFDYVWIVRPEYAKQFPTRIRLVGYNSIQSIKELATAQIWIDNCRKDAYIRKRKKQLYIETWHNGMSLKQVERAIEANLSKSYLVRAKNDSKMVNVFLSNSSFATERYKKDFWYNGDILETGLPRNDVLFKDKDALRNKINHYFNLSGNKRLLLYAPTFRKDFNTDIYIDDFKNIIDALSNRFGGEWVVLYHLHPNIADKGLSIVYSDLVLNGTDYPDFQEIMVASDVLITDYSSVMFEFSFMQKPVFLLMADKEEYINDRNFAMSLDSIPYPQSLNLNELIENIKRFNKSNYLDNVTKFFNTNAFFEDGHASERVVNFIKERVEYI